MHTEHIEQREKTLWLTTMGAASSIKCSEPELVRMSLGNVP